MRDLERGPQLRCRIGLNLGSGELRLCVGQLGAEVIEAVPQLVGPGSLARQGLLCPICPEIGRLCPISLYLNGSLCTISPRFGSICPIFCSICPFFGCFGSLSQR